MAFLTGQSCRVLKSWYTGEGQEQGFWRCFADGLNQSLQEFRLRHRLRYNRWHNRNSWWAIIWGKWRGCSSENVGTPLKGTRILFYGRVPNSFPPLRGSNSTTTNYITGTANSNSNDDNSRTLSSQGLLESMVINLYPNKAYQLWQRSFYALAP